MKATLRAGLEGVYRYRVPETKTVPRIYAEGREARARGSRLVRAICTAFALVLATTGTASWAQRAPLPEVGVIASAQLPPEARDTLLLIRKGGPFPYAKDGAVFGNREGILPKHKRGYYREYTVKTPGERTRGARRIVAGRGGEYYYTDDHYNHFRRIRE